MLRVGIVGCGKIADAHATQILQLEGTEIIAACDREPLMVRQLAERFPVKYQFSDLQKCLSETQPDVVHITTPPQSHFEIAKLCLENGSHVYVEKPFTVNAEEAKALVHLATSRNLKLTVGHNYQFSHAARRMRALIRDGYLGGMPVHMESLYCYDLSDRSYARAVLGDQEHWVRRLPGRLLQNIISHGIARIAEFLQASDPVVIAYGYSSPFLKEIGEAGIIDELRVIISEGERTTAYFTFSSQMKPSQQEFRIYGQKNGLMLDQSHEILLRLRGTKFKSYADFFIPPVLFARQHLSNLSSNARLFLHRDFQMDTGMKHLIGSFYRSITHNVPLPISYREIVLTAKIMDEIFAQVYSRRQEYTNVLSRPLAVKLSES